MSAQIIHLRDRIPAGLYSTLQHYLSGAVIEMLVTTITASGDVERQRFDSPSQIMGSSTTGKPCDIYKLIQSTKADEVTA